MSYDSKKDTTDHINRVRDYIAKCIVELEDRASLHDHDKIDDPTEKALFDEYSPKLARCTYGSDEYKSFLTGLKPALDRHYKNSRHHPEHFENGMKDMNLIDLLELICDWKASSERHEDGDIFKSIEINQQRFNYSDDLKSIFKNTVEFLNNQVASLSEDAALEEEVDIFNSEPRPLMCIRSDNNVWGGGGDSYHELKVGQIYYASEINVYDCYTYVRIKGFDRDFNSVLFRELTKKEEVEYYKFGEV